MTSNVDNLVVEQNLAHATWTPGLTTQALVGGTTTLTATSTTSQIFTGSTAGQVLKLPDAQLLAFGWKFVISNDSPNIGGASMAVQDNGGGALATVLPSQRLIAVCTSIGSAAGTWSITIEEKSTGKYKAGIALNSAFAPANPRKATITFSAAFADANYSVVVTGGDGRFFTVESKLAASFVINTNSATALGQSVNWFCKAVGEN